MIKYATATSLIVLLTALAPTATQAESIKDQVSDSALAAYCSDVGVDTETTASVTLPDGTTVTGTVECEAEDLNVSSDDGLDDGLDDGFDDGLDDSEDDDGSDDDGSDDDSSDDDGSDDDSSDDDSSDDDSSDDGDDSEDDSDSEDDGDDSEDD